MLCMAHKLTTLLDVMCCWLQALTLTRLWARWPRWRPQHVATPGPLASPLTVSKGPLTVSKALNARERRLAAAAGVQQVVLTA